MLEILANSIIELNGCQAALFEWVESYDTKDFERLRKCIAPTLRVRLDRLCTIIY